MFGDRLLCKIIKSLKTGKTRTKQTFTIKATIYMRIQKWNLGTLWGFQREWSPNWAREWSRILVIVFKYWYLCSNLMTLMEFFTNSNWSINTNLRFMAYIRLINVEVELSSKGSLRTEKSWLRTSFRHVFNKASSGLRKTLYVIIFQLQRWL